MILLDFFSQGRGQRLDRQFLRPAKALEDVFTIIRLLRFLDYIWLLVVPYV